MSGGQLLLRAASADAVRCVLAPAVVHCEFSLLPQPEIRNRPGDVPHIRSLPGPGASAV